MYTHKLWTGITTRHHKNTTLAPDPTD